MPERTLDMLQSGDARRDKITEISGENVYQCMQCGNCSAVCPMTGSMEVTPRKAMLLLQYCMIEELERTAMSFTCSSCHSCMVVCPRGIDISRVLEAVRQLVLRRKGDHLRLPDIPVETIEDAPAIAMVSAFRKHTG